MRQSRRQRPPAVIDDQHGSNGFVTILKLPQNEFVSGIPRLQRLICTSWITLEYELTCRAFKHKVLYPLQGVERRDVAAPTRAGRSTPPMILVLGIRLA